MDPRFIPIFMFGLIGGLVAFFIGAPMPFMLGGIFGTACFVLWYERDDKQLPKVSRWVRLISMSVIGAMIGSRFSPDLLTLLPMFWISGLALIPFIITAHAGNYAIMRGLGGYRPLDAYFAALPGGIMDSAALAEQAGADLRVVTAQHFIRIILVVTSVPLLFLVVEGNVVGSLAGETLATADYDLADLTTLFAIAITGLLIGQRTGLPVSHMLGPLLLALVLSVSGVVSIDEALASAKSGDRKIPYPTRKTVEDFVGKESVAELIAWARQRQEQGILVIQPDIRTDERKRRIFMPDVAD